MKRICTVLLLSMIISPAYAEMNSDLTIAAYNGDTSQIKALLDKGVDINTISHSKWTALMYAASRGKTGAVKLLLDRGADVQIKDRNGYTALMLAALSGHKTAVQTLLNKGADIDVKAKNGYTAWKLAKEEGHHIIATILQRAKTGDINRIRIPIAAIKDEKKDYDDLDRLLRRQNNAIKTQRPKTGPNTIYSGWFYLGTFSENKKKWFQKTIQGFENRVPEKGEKVTLSAPMYLRDDKPREKKNARLVPPFNLPMKTGFTVKSIDAKVGFGQVWAQVQFSENDIIKSAKRAGKIDLDFLVAVNKGDTKAVLAALKMNPDINARYKDGMTPLIRAAKKGYTKIVAEILNRDPEIDAVADDGWTALMTAAWKGHKDIVEALLDKKAAVNKVSYNQWTALLAASKYGHLDIVKMLITKGADIKVKNRHKKTALMLARKKGHTKIVNLLKP